MKVAGVALALALCASASPIRIISLSDSPSPFSDPPSGAPPHVEKWASPPIWAFSKPSSPGKPCTKHRAPPAGGIGALLAKFGFSAPRPSPPHIFDFDIPPSASREHVDELIEGAKHRIEEIEKEGVSMVEGGVVKILPFQEAGAFRLEREPSHEEWRNRGWRQKHHHHHHHHDEVEGAGGRGRGRMYWRHHHSFGARLAHALRHLSTPEIIALIFVLGVGTGSLLHVGIVMFIIFLRISRGGGLAACKERRALRRAARKAAKAERKAAKKAAKLGKDEGKVRLEGPEEVRDEPPRYEDHAVVEYDEKV